MLDSLWDIFIRTGSVSDYLNYVNLKNSEVQNDFSITADNNQGACNK